MRVFVTGSSGCLARALLARLCLHTHVEHVLGIDLKPATFAHPKFSSEIGDMRDSKNLARMQGCVAVVHLGFAIGRGEGTNEHMRDNNVNGTMHVFAAAHQAGIQKVINLSSVSVYGSGENIVESTALNPSSKFPYACHKAEIEHRCEKEYPEVVHLRSHFIFGPNAHPFLHALCNSRVYISLPRPVPRLQAVHEYDVAQAIIKALELPVAGAFNLAAPEAVTLAKFVKNGRKLMFPLPLGMVRAAALLAKQLGSKADFTHLDVIDTELTVVCDRAKELLHWTPVFTAWDARSAMFEPRNSYFLKE